MGQFEEWKRVVNEWDGNVGVDVMVYAGIRIDMMRFLVVFLLSAASRMLVSHKTNTNVCLCNTQRQTDSQLHELATMISSYNELIRDSS